MTMMITDSWSTSRRKRSANWRILFARSAGRIRRHGELDRNATSAASTALSTSAFLHTPKK